MPHFADSLRASIEADARAHSGAQAPVATRRTIGRRRVAANLGYGAGSALAVGSVAVAAATLMGQDSPTPASSLSPTPTVEPTTSYATVDLNDPVIANRQHATQALCGAPAPIPTGSTQGMSAEFDIITDGDFAHQGSGEDPHHIGTVVLRGQVEDKLPAYIHQPQAVFVHDGVVVGMGAYHQSVGWHMLSNGWEGTYPLFLYGLPSACGDDILSAPLEAGEYEMYVVSKVTASEVEAAIDAAQRAGVSLPSADMLPVYQPGSYECERLYNRDVMGLPLSCDESAMPGASIDVESQSATIPYESVIYDRDLDVTLVSEPVTVQIEEYVDPHTAQQDSLREPFTGDVAPICGDEYSHPSGTELVSYAPTSLTKVAPGNTLELDLWLTSPRWIEVTVDLPATARVWLMEEHLVPLDGEAGSSVFYEVAGWIDVAADELAVTIERYDGPQPWHVKATDVSWCDGEQPESIREGWMVAPLSLTDDAGTRTDTAPVRIVAGE